MTHEFGEPGSHTQPAPDAAATDRPGLWTRSTRGFGQDMMFTVVRLLLGCLFIFASFDKLRFPEPFARILYNYHILPDAGVNLVAIILPWLEILLGLCLVAGVWLPGAVLIATGLLCAFTAALAFNLARGLDVRCGCFATGITTDPATLITVLRDGVFLVPALYILIRIFGADPTDSGTGNGS